MNFVSGDNASRQLDFKEGEAEQYPGFVRRASSGYQKYYPPEQQIQLYKPKPAPFYGQTTAGDSYKKWELQPKPRLDEDMAPPPHIPFTGTTTNRSDFHAHPLERRDDREAAVYEPSTAPFYGQTTAGDSFKKWELQPKPRLDEDMAPPPHIPFTGTTTNRSDYRRHSLGNDALSLGVATRGGVFQVLIPRTETRPCSSSQIFTTVQDNQSVVRIQIYQGERDIAVENELLGQFELHGISPAPMGVPQVEVFFDINAKNELAVMARDCLTGKQQQVKFVASQIQCDRDRVKQLTASAKKSQRSDANAKTLIEGRNKAQNIIYEVRQMLRRSGAAGQMDGDIQELERAMENNNNAYELEIMARDLVRKGRDSNLFV
jgi:hypothetical protein